MSRHIPTLATTVLAVALLTNACSGTPTLAPVSSATAPASAASSASAGSSPSPSPSPGVSPGATAGPSPTNLPAATAQPSPASDPIAQALADRLHKATYTADTTAAAVEALARSGIGTYAEPTAASAELALTGPTSPLQLLDFQAHALAVDAWAGHGLAGSELDTLLPIPNEIHDRTAPASAFLAGYVAAVDSPGAALARALMADQDLTRPEDLHFPLIVLHLFASDLATDGGQRPAATAPSVGFSVIEAHATQPQRSASGGSGQAGVATLCSDAASFIDKTIHALFNLLKASVPDNTVGAIVVTIWNWIVDQGEAFVRLLLDAVTDAVLATVRWIAGGIAAIASQVSALVPYVVTVRVDPSARIDLGNSRVLGAFVATVTAGDLPDWPDVMKDCAKTAQVALPSFRGRDEPVTWGEPVVDVPGILTALRADPRTDGNGEASWVFGTGPDPGEAPGTERVATVAIDVTIHRSALDDARKSLSNALFGGIPPILRGFVDELFGFFIDPIQKAVAALIDTHASGSAFIVYHDVPPATPTPAETQPPAGIEGTWQGSWSSNTYAGLSGGFRLNFVRNGTKLSGRITITGSRCISGGTITGSLKGNRIQFGAVQGAETIGYSGIFSGNAMSGTWNVLQASGGECTNDSGPWEAGR